MTLLKRQCAFVAALPLILNTDTRYDERTDAWPSLEPPIKKLKEESNITWPFNV